MDGYQLIEDIIRTLSIKDLSELILPQCKKSFIDNAIYADKWRTRLYQVKGSENILLAYGVWEKGDDIDFDVLPDKFLKPNNGSGGIFLQG